MMFKEIIALKLRTIQDSEAQHAMLLIVKTAGTSGLQRVN